MALPPPGVKFKASAMPFVQMENISHFLRACELRFRPILMTTFAAVFGALPLAIGLGEGSELRRPLGVAIVGGLLVSQLLTLYTTPVVYLYLDRLQRWLFGDKPSAPIEDTEQPIHAQAAE